MLGQENLIFDAYLILFSRKVKGKDQHVRHLAPNPGFAPGLLFSRRIGPAFPQV